RQKGQQQAHPLHASQLRRLGDRDDPLRRPGGCRRHGIHAVAVPRGCRHLRPGRRGAQADRPGRAVNASGDNHLPSHHEADRASGGRENASAFFARVAPRRRRCRKPAFCPRVAPIVTITPAVSGAAPVCGKDFPRMIPRKLLTLVLALASLATIATAAPTAASILPDGSFERLGSSTKRPTGWPGGRAISWPVEDGNRFLRITSTAAGRMDSLNLSVPLDSNIRALELTYRARVTGMKRGEKSWHDARIILNFKNA